MFAFAIMIVSSIVGAGFATGAELAAFFGGSTLPPIAIAVLVGLFLFAYIFIIVSNVLKKNRSLPDWLIKTVSFIFLVAMIAGISSLSGPLVAAASTIGSCIVVWLGFERAVVINKYIMCFALVVLLFVAFTNASGTIAKPNLAPNFFDTFFMALLYASMNCFMLVAVFREALTRRSRKEILWSGFLATVIISFFVLIILTAIKIHNMTNAVMPVLELDKSAFTWLAIFVSILTSMYFAMLGISAKKNNSIKMYTANLSSKKNWLRKESIFITACGAAYAASFLGFKKIIAVFYPIVGVIMIFYLFFVCFFWCRDYYVSRRTRVH